jgi:hypothetical protein
MARILNIGAGYDGEITYFHLRSISVAEDNRYAARFLEIPDTADEERKAELSYGIFVDALVSWSESGPTKKEVDGKEVALYPDAETPADAVRKFFEERTPNNERLAPAVVGRYRTMLQPEVVFY